LMFSTVFDKGQRKTGKIKPFKRSEIRGMGKMKKRKNRYVFNPGGPRSEF